MFFIWYIKHQFWTSNAIHTNIVIFTLRQLYQLHLWLCAHQASPNLGWLYLWFHRTCSTVRKHAHPDRYPHRISVLPRSFPAAFPSSPHRARRRWVLLWKTVCWRPHLFHCFGTQPIQGSPRSEPRAPSYLNACISQLAKCISGLGFRPFFITTSLLPPTCKVVRTLKTCNLFTCPHPHHPAEYKTWKYQNQTADLTFDGRHHREIIKTRWFKCVFSVNNSMGRISINRTCQQYINCYNTVSIY